MYLEKAIFKNIAPFGDLEVSFTENQVVVLSGINGRGKTTILSYVADAFFELARQADFADVFEDKTKYYRVTSMSTVFNAQPYSLVYLRFKNGSENFDYIEIVGKIEEQKYNEIVGIDNKILFSEFSRYLNEAQSYKHIKVDQKKAKELFEKKYLNIFSIR